MLIVTGRLAYAAPVATMAPAATIPKSSFTTRKTIAEFYGGCPLGRIICDLTAANADRVAVQSHLLGAHDKPPYGLI